MNAAPSNAAMHVTVALLSYLTSRRPGRPRTRTQNGTAGWNPAPPEFLVRVDIRFRLLIGREVAPVMPLCPRCPSNRAAGGGHSGLSSDGLRAQLALRRFGLFASLLRPGNKPSPRRSPTCHEGGAGPPTRLSSPTQTALGMRSLLSGSGLELSIRLLVEVC